MPLLSRQHRLSWPPRYVPGSVRGFSLLELLVSIGIGVTILSLAIPAVMSRKQSSDLTHSVSKLTGVMEQARAYAMTNNTHVFVGINEFDASVNSSVVPQNAASSQRGGRVVLVTIASLDGTRGYDSASPGTLSGTAMLVIGKVQRFENLHLVDLNPHGDPPATGAMARRTAPETSRVGNEHCISLTPFCYPLTGVAQYIFSIVIEFEPTGEAKIVSQSGGSSSKLIEIGLQSTHSNAAPSAPADQNIGNHVAIQIDGLTGSLRTYRP